MSIFDRRPALRWAVPAGACAAILIGTTLAPLGAAADSGLPPRTAQELLVALSQPSTDTVSGTIATDAELGLPELPMGMSGPGPMGMAMGASTVRVWLDGPQRQRVALLENEAETTLIRNGTLAWVWSSQASTADRYTLPEHGATAPGTADWPSGTTGELPLGTALPSTPQEAAAMALAALDPTTEVTTAGVAKVAGRDAYELILTPRDAATLVDRVVIAIDAQTSVPLRVRVYSTRTAEPAVEVGFTSVDYGTPDPALFTFTPPQGATVTEHAAPGAQELADAPGADAPGAQGAEPTVVGSGWSTIVVGELPADWLANLAEDGTRAEGDRHRRSADPAATALALLEAMPATSGPWGTGRVLAGTLVSAILTDDGRFAIGAVSPEALGSALAEQ